MSTTERINSLNFAIYLYQRAVERGITPNVTQIQKWLYVCYGIFLRAHNSQLLDEKPEAWDYGPFFPNVHKAQKKTDGNLALLASRINENDFVDFIPIIDVVMRHFGNLTAGQLVDWTHEVGSAWHQQWHGRKKSGGRYTAMDNHDIILDFERLYSNG